METDLFEADNEDLFCPLDGQKLIFSKWEWCGNQLVTCPKGHVWEASWSRMWQNQLKFDVIEMVNCPDCGQLCPKRLMRSESGKQEGKKVCPDCFEKIKQAWRPDTELSYGRLVITPIRRGDKVRFEYEQEVKILPYPNPYMSGGLWGMGAVETEAEIEKLIEEFTSNHWWYERWQEMGVKFEVIRKPEMTAAEYLNEREREYVEEHPEEAGNPVHAQMQLIV